MCSLGIADTNLQTLGNLKYDTPQHNLQDRAESNLQLPADRLIFLAGSTHEGEEEILLAAYTESRERHPELYLVLVPRDPARAGEILKYTKSAGLKAVIRSENSSVPGDLLIVDTIGELAALYSHSAIAFVGGSMVKEGGHNPIEPANMSVPVLFGPHMDDFREIADDLLTAGGAAVVADKLQLVSTLEMLLSDQERRNRMGRAASACVQARKGVVSRHIELIRSFL
jgi:3-deoxy-D-manno-octulosonic-acid transferase